MVYFSQVYLDEIRERYINNNLNTSGVFMGINVVRFMGPQLENQKKQSVKQIQFRGVNKQSGADVLTWKGKTEEPETKLNPITPLLHNLFKSLPKTELHMHLSGSTPVKIIRDIMREKGMPEKEIMEQTTFDPNFHGLDDFLRVYYKVAWVVESPDHFKRAAKQICLDAADENVKYLEIRTSVIGKGGKPDEILQAVTDGINEAKNELKAKGFEQKAKIIVLAQRHHAPAESLEHAKIAENWSKKQGSLVVGFDLAGPEDGFPISFHEEAIRYAKQAGLKVTLHAGETPGSHYRPNEKLSPIFGDKPVDLEPCQSMRLALDYGTDRLGHGVHMYDDPEVAKEIIEKQIPVESPPKCNVQLGSVASYAAHPIKKMLDDGVNVSLSTDNRTISSTDLTEEYEQLYKHNVIASWSDIKKLVMNGAKSVFLPPEERAELIKHFEKELKAIEVNPVYNEVIEKYLTPAQKALSFMGKKLGGLLNKNAA